LLLARRRPDRRLRRVVVLIMASRWLSIGAEAPGPHSSLSKAMLFQGSTSRSWHN